MARKAEKEREKERIKEETRRRRRGVQLMAMKGMRMKYIKEYDQYGRLKLKDRRRIFKKDMKTTRVRIINSVFLWLVKTFLR